MPLTASQLLEQRMEKDKQAMESSFQNDMSMVNRRFGPISRNQNIETARIQALSRLRKQYEDRASKLMAKYEEQNHPLQEIDALAQAGQLGTVNPEEIKLRTVLTPEVEKVVFPKEETDPVTEHSRLSAERSRVQSELRRFEIEGPRVHESSVFSKPWFMGGGGGKVRSIGGRVRVIEKEYDEKLGKEREVSRDATKEELEEWASLTEYERQIKAKLNEIRRSEPMAARLRLAAARSPRMGAAGSFADKAVGGATAKTVKTTDDPLGLFK